jgi:hypothetical protein
MVTVANAASSADMIANIIVSRKHICSQWLPLGTVAFAKSMPGGRR